MSTDYPDYLLALSTNLRSPLLNCLLFIDLHSGLVLRTIWWLCLVLVFKHYMFVFISYKHKNILPESRTLVSVPGLSIEQDTN